MALFTYGNTVRVKRDVPGPRAGQEAEVVAMTLVEDERLAVHHRVAIGTTVYLVEFGDGDSAEFPESALDPAQ